MEFNLKQATKLDAKDTLRKFRNEFHFPKDKKGKDLLYFCGNSLGLQPKGTKKIIKEHLEDWARWGVEGHFHARKPWLPYHEFVTDSLCRLVGAKKHEVVAMNSLSVNLHLLMVSFFKPKGARKKILIEETAFPSDEYAVKSQLKFHGLNPETDLIKCPTTDEGVLDAIKKYGSEIALVMIGNVNYLTGYAFDLKTLAAAIHEAGALFGVDLAHGIGNLELNLHADKVDFATWCSYKYLNAGPGGISGIYVNEKWGMDSNTFQFAGWWGHDKKTRFKMGPDFFPIGGAESWQLSNPPILQLAALRASLDLFDKAKISRLRKKSEGLVAFMELGLRREIPEIKITTPAEKQKRGTQLSLDISNAPKNLTAKLLKLGLVCDFREPNILRLAPAPLYTRHVDVFHALAALKKGLS